MKADLPHEAVSELKGGTLSTIDAVAMAVAVLSPAIGGFAPGPRRIGQHAAELSAVPQLVEQI